MSDTDTSAEPVVHVAAERAVHQANAPAAPAHTEHKEHHQHHSAHAHVTEEHTSDSASEPWVARVLFGIAGVLLLAGAYVAWQFKDMLGGEVGQALPWLIAA